MLFETKRELAGALQEEQHDTTTLLLTPRDNCLLFLPNKIERRSETDWMLGERLRFWPNIKTDLG